MASAMGVFITIGAGLAGGFRSAIGSAVSGIGDINRAGSDLTGTFLKIGQAAAAFGLIGSAVSKAADVQAQLNDIGITADMSREQVGELGDYLRKLSVPTETNQSVVELGKGYAALVSAGMSQEQATGSIRAIGRTATAANADIEDLSKTAFILVDTLGVAPGDLSAELDRLAFAGKQGAFELKDMARYFPTLGASAKNLGLQGTEAVATLGAALQIAKKGAADPSEAANNMKNFMAKITAPETVKKFKEHGVNLKKVLKEAMAKGENPMEAVIAKIQTMTKGDPFKIGQLFGDMQVMDFLKPMLANMDEYNKLKADILSAKGVSDADFARRMEDANQQMKAGRIAVENLGVAVGNALLPAIGRATAVVTPVINLLTEGATKFPATTVAVVGVAAGFAILPPAITLATVAFRIFTTALLANPIGLVVGALAIGAGLIIDNWGEVKAFMLKVWDGVEEGFNGFLAWIAPVTDAAAEVINQWTPAKEFLTGLWDTVLVAWDKGVSEIMALWDKVSGPIQAVTDFLGLTGGGDVEAKAQAAEAQIKAAQPGAAVANGPGSALAANDNAKGGTANDNRPGAAYAAAEARGKAAMAGGSAAAPASQAAAAPSGKVEVEVRFANAPPGASMSAKSSSASVVVSANTGKTMSGAN